MPRDRHARVSREVAAGRRAAAEAIAAGRAEELLLVEGADAPGLREVVEAAQRARVGVRRTERAELDRLADDHRGVVATLRVAAPAALGERELASFPFAGDAVVVVLDGVTDPQNLGAAARSCEAAGVAMLVTRMRRAARATPAAIRASSGALLHLPQARVANIPRAISRLQDAGFTVAGLDENADRSIYDEPRPAGRIAVVVGSEGEGMSRLVRERCDILVSLPMRGRVASLNVSASVAATLYGWVLANHGR
jgi:23S rRNA (guanosine2251-2'-O)-methyltransferase